MKLGVEAALVDGLLVRGDVEVDDGRIVAVGLSSPGRGIAVPGFIDLQVNGFGGVDFLDADADGYRRAGEALLETGVTAYLPTLITTPEHQLVAAMAEVPSGESRPRILGMHLEGPFLSPNRLGTHEASARRDPDLAMLDRLLAAGAGAGGQPWAGAPGAPAPAAPPLAPAPPGAPGRRRADRPAARAQRRSVARPHRRDCGAGERCLRPRGTQRHASLQRHAAVPASRPGHRRRCARTGRRGRLDHPRRHPPRAGD